MFSTKEDICYSHEMVTNTYHYRDDINIKGVGVAGRLRHRLKNNEAIVYIGSFATGSV